MTKVGVGPIHPKKYILPKKYIPPKWVYKKYET